MSICVCACSLLATEDAAASKTEAVSQLLNAFNEGILLFHSCTHSLGDYLKSNDMNTELLRADLERIYESELAVVKNTHVSKALNTPVRQLICPVILSVLTF